MHNVQIPVVTSKGVCVLSGTLIRQRDRVIIVTPNGIAWIAQN